MNSNKEIFYPEVGERLYLRQFTNNYMIDMVKRPYTVIKVTEDKVIIQAADLIFNGPRYYDTMADDIVEDKHGLVEELRWHPKRRMWGTKGRDVDYPQYAVFGKYEFHPYLD